MHTTTRPINKRLALTCTIAVSLWLASCGEPNERLDEHVFYNGPQINLKLVRYYRNIPFNYLGEHAVVMCQSANTREFQKQDPHDSGWRILGDAGDQKGKDARELTQDIKHQYQVIDDRILIATLQAINISFDACGSFVSWDPTRLPSHMIHAVDKPDSCAPQGPADCRYLDFEGERLPSYEQIDIRNDREVSFTVRSSAFRDVQALRVQSNDGGKHWQVEGVPQDEAAQSSSVPGLQVFPADVAE